MDAVSARAPGRCIVRLVGEFDAADRHRLIDTFAVAQDSTAILVDLGECSSIDCSSLECLIALHKACEKRGSTLTVTGPRETVLQLLKVTQLDRLLNVRDRIADVVAWAGAQSRQLTLEASPRA